MAKVVRFERRYSQLATFMYECEPVFFIIACLLVISIGVQGFIKMNFLKSFVIMSGGIFLFFCLAFWRVWLSHWKVAYVGGFTGWIVITFCFLKIVADNDFNLLP